ncbi:hypothetical protein IQ07DRAFT_59678 [Pyrenochaeta sp. DS3sAY3a]|nr:hypothetical protein IQ07DRAFT_59678 [Pyrenochaeta sp. DS3sAY3a]
MDDYPKINISERECSRAHSPASLDSKPPTTNPTTSTQPCTHCSNTHLAPPQYTSFPPPTSPKPRNDSVHDMSNDSSTNASTDGSTNADGADGIGELKVERLEAEYARYLDAPPPYEEKAYEGKSEAESTRMRMGDYAKELSRMMGRQLVRGLKGGEREKEKERK